MRSIERASGVRLRPGILAAIGAAAILAPAVDVLAAALGLTVLSARVQPRKGAVCEDTTISCTSSAECANGRACIGTGFDTWAAKGEVDAGADAEAFMREIDRDGILVAVSATSGAWPGAEVFFEGGECAPAGGDNATVAEKGVRCASGGNSRSFLLKPRRRADGSNYLRLVVKMRKQSDERPAPVASETPLGIGVDSTTYTATDDVSPCRDLAKGGVTCREP